MAMPIVKGSSGEWLHPAQSSPCMTQILLLLPTFLLHVGSASPNIPFNYNFWKNYKGRVNVTNFGPFAVIGPHLLRP